MAAGASAVEPLLALALEAQARAYAPYSRFHVGAAIETDDGRRFVGCNVENLSYGATICAERTALVTAVSAGARRFRRLVLVSDAPDPVAPCGLCRQVLHEFAPDLGVLAVGATGAERRWTLRELLPEAFIADLTPRLFFPRRERDDPSTS